ncbi:DinB family protein [Paenibacillus sp. 2TAF8]|uniref:DinB family protein n=1 Tax=Paenibacillus sp. 2TAF8 TaxID=3233020 RepID=UPI003F994887
MFSLNVTLQKFNITREALLHSISQVNNQEINVKVSEHKWSIGQVCEHLVITESLFSKILEAALLTEEKIILSKDIQVIKDRQVEFEAPHYAEPQSSNYDVSDLKVKLSGTREKLNQVINGQTDLSIFTKRVAEHFYFKELRLDQWIELLYLHEGRHIKQIEDLQKQIVVKLRESGYIK